MFKNTLSYVLFGVTMISDGMGCFIKDLYAEGKEKIKKFFKKDNKPVKNEESDKNEKINTDEKIVYYATAGIFLYLLLCIFSKIILMSIIIDTAIAIINFIKEFKYVY